MGSIGWIPHGYRSELRGWLALGTIVTGSVFEKKVFHGCSGMLEAFGAGRWWTRWLTSDGVLSCILGGQRGSVEMVTRQSEGGIGVEGDMQRSASPDAGVDVPFLHLHTPKSGLRSCGFGSKVWIGKRARFREMSTKTMPRHGCCRALRGGQNMSCPYRLSASYSPSWA